MRASLFSAAVVAALAATGLTPRGAQAQVVVYPSINTSPYAYPAYSYGYTYNYPGYWTSSYGWTNPYSTYNWSWYRNYPVYTGSYWGRSPYWRGGYRGWYRRW
jgi:hypothetical protein